MSVPNLACHSHIGIW